MISSHEVSAPSGSAQWQSIDWKAVERHVLRLQIRIAKAVREGKHGKAKALQWILDNIPTDKRMLKQWLECGYIDKGLFYKTAEGTPQGGIISPTLMLLTLVGLEKLTKSIARKTGSRVNFIGYADDFVITGSSKEVLVNDIKPQLMAFTRKRFNAF